MSKEILDSEDKDTSLSSFAIGRDNSDFLIISIISYLFLIWSFNYKMVWCGLVLMLLNIIRIIVIYLIWKK